MLKKLAGFAWLLCFAVTLDAQRNCVSYEYSQQLVTRDPLLLSRIVEIENFTQRNSGRELPISAFRHTEDTIRIPVVVHVLYHYPHENIGEEKIIEQIGILNRDFGKRNSDTVKIPSAFAPLAANTKIEFQLATRDSRGRASNGIVRRYTPVKKWVMDDKMKFSSEMGSDAWDAASYLNIWICNLEDLLGYASFPGAPAERDGVVLNYKIVGEVGYFGAYNKGRTAVHEVGHWLNLRHIWGDADCGNDAVDDTPTQRSYTPGCPSGIRVTCGNAPAGDMYMNYMDFTSDACVYMFTLGQKARMRSLFAPGGFRHSLLSSQGLDTPAIEEAPLPEEPPRWLHIKIYPNPASTVLTLNFEHDIRWIGRQFQVIDISGRILMKKTITSSVQQLDVSGMKPGVYFIRGEKEGEKLMERFLKL